MSLSSVGLQVFSYLVRPEVEGGLSLDPQDRGNWTGGRVGVGELRGTKYGISAAAHPDLDIAALTLAAAQGLFEREYWNPIQGARLPAPLAVCVADDAYNHGVDLAVRTLQHVLGVRVDGQVGEQTLQAANAHKDPLGLLLDFQAARALEYLQDPEASRYAKGWVRARILGTTLAAIGPGGILGAQSTV